MIVRATAASIFWAGAAAYSQTTINNTTNNTTNIVIQQRQMVVVNRPAPAPRTPFLAPPPSPSSFPYQPRDLLPYMSPRCAQLYEVQLTGYRQRISSSTAAGIRDEFQSNCPDAINEARKELFQAKQGKYNAAQDQKMAARNAAERDRATQEQCSELLRILAGKRKHLDSMTDGEKADHARFEQNYAARCKGV